MKNLLLLFAFLLSMGAQAQEAKPQAYKALYLRPMAMGGYVVSGFGQKPDHFKRYGGVMGSIGGFLDFRWHERMQISVGLHPIAIGAAYKVAVPKNMLRFSKELTATRNGDVYGLALPISFQYSLKEVQCLGKKEKDNFLIRFKLMGIAGISLSKYRDGQFMNTLGGGAFISKSAAPNTLPDLNKDEDDYVETVATPSIIHHRNISLEVGIGLQFFNKLRHNGLRLDLLYSQGLVKQQEIGIAYEINQQYTGTASIISRGSWAALRLSVPIRLKKWGE